MAIGGSDQHQKKTEMRLLMELLGKKQVNEESEINDVDK